MDEKILDEIIEDNAQTEQSEQSEQTPKTDYSDRLLGEGEYPDDAIAEMVNGSSSRYINYSDKYEDAKSTAYTLIIFAVIGLSAIILSISGVIDKYVKLPFNLKNQLLMTVSMSVLFVVFLVIGIKYFFKTNEYKNMIGSEKSNTEKVINWMKENVSEDIAGSDVSEAELYFKRCEIIKDKLMREFEDVDENLIDKLIDDNYDELFSK